MGKYGPGVSMKTVISNEVASVQSILDRSNLSEEDKTSVINAIKEMAYQWCAANANACAIEDAAKNILNDPVKWQEMAQAVMTSSVQAVKMVETYPFV